MANEEKPRTDFGDGGVGSQKGPFVGGDAGILPDEQKLPDENPLLMEDNGSLREHDRGQTRANRRQARAAPRPLPTSFATREEAAVRPRSATETRRAGGS